MDLIYFNARMQKTQPNVIRLRFKITAAKTVSELAPGGGTVYSFDAITQATFDAFQELPASDVPAANYDSTAMGTDAFGGAVCMMGYSGQVAKLLKMTTTLRSSTDLATVASKTAYGSAGMTASTLATECGVTTAGNIMFRAVHTGLDALTSGLLEFELEWLAK